MEIRYFQVTIPLFVLLLLLWQIREYLKTRSGLYETLLISLFWVGIAIVAIFPDFFSGLIAKTFGIKDNVNAIIFFALGLGFYFQLQIYKLLKKQDQQLTELTRKVALDNAEKK